MHWIAKFASRLWTREKPDGKKAAGAGRILFFITLLLGGGYWTVTRMASASSGAKAASFTGGDKAKGPNPVLKEMQVAEVVAAAQEGREPELKKGPKEELAGSVVGVDQEKKARKAGFFGESATARQAQDEPASGSIFDALAQTETPDPQSKDGRRNSRESLEIRGNSRALAPIMAGGNGTSGQATPIEALLVQNTRLTPSKLSTTESGASIETQRDIRDRTVFWLPRGELVRVYLMNEVQTGQDDALVEFAVAETISFNGRAVLPFGTRFLATVASTGVRDRINFKVDALRRRDGLSIPVSAVVVGDDRFSGMRGYYIPPPTMAQLAPYLGSFATAFADLVKDKVTEQTAQGVTNLATNSVGLVANSQPPLKDTVQEAAVYATARAIGSFVDSNVKELNERYAPYLYVVRGSTAYVQLRQDTDLTAFWDQAVKPPSASSKGNASTSPATAADVRSGSFEAPGSVTNSAK